MTGPSSIWCDFSDLEQLRKIRRRSPHDDTEAFTVFLRSDVEAKSVHSSPLLFWKTFLALCLWTCLLNQFLSKWWYIKYYSIVRWSPCSEVCMCLTSRALDVWGSPEALDRERKLRKEVEREYEESRYPQACKFNQWLLKTWHAKGLYMWAYAMFTCFCVGFFRHTKSDSWNRCGDALIYPSWKCSSPAFTETWLVTGSFKVNWHPQA